MNDSRKLKHEEQPGCRGIEAVGESKQARRIELTGCLPNPLLPREEQVGRIKDVASGICRTDTTQDEIDVYD
jgi:hypothetical protein